MFKGLVTHCLPDPRAAPTAGPWGLCRAADTTRPQTDLPGSSQWSCLSVAPHADGAWHLLVLTLKWSDTFSYKHPFSWQWKWWIDFFTSRRILQRLWSPRCRLTLEWALHSVPCLDQRSAWCQGYLCSSLFPSRVISHKRCFNQYLMELRPFLTGVCEECLCWRATSGVAGRAPARNGFLGKDREARTRQVPGWPHMQAWEHLHNPWAEWLPCDLANRNRVIWVSQPSWNINLSLKGKGKGGKKKTQHQQNLHCRWLLLTHFPNNAGKFWPGRELQKTEIWEELVWVLQQQQEPMKEQELLCQLGGWPWSWQQVQGWGRDPAVWDHELRTRNRDRG